MRAERNREGGREGGKIASRREKECDQLLVPENSPKKNTQGTRIDEAILTYRTVSVPPRASEISPTVGTILLFPDIRGGLGSLLADVVLGRTIVGYLPAYLVPSDQRGWLVS